MKVFLIATTATTGF